MTTIDPSDLPIILTENHSVAENLLIDGAGAPSAEFAIFIQADHCTVRNVHVTNMPRIGIGARGVRRALIERAVVENSGMQGIWNERDCDGSTVINSEVVNSGKDNIQIAGTNGSVLNCQTSGAGAGRPYYAGIYVAANSRRTLVADNICTGNGTGVDVSWGFQDGNNRNGGDLSNGIIVRGNRSFENNGSGISCASNGAIITGNQCLDNGVKPGPIPSNGIGLLNANGCLIADNVMVNNTVG